MKKLTSPFPRLGKVYVNGSENEYTGGSRRGDPDGHFAGDAAVCSLVDLRMRDRGLRTVFGGPEPAGMRRPLHFLVAFIATWRQQQEIQE